MVSARYCFGFVENKAHFAANTIYGNDKSEKLRLDVCLIIVSLSPESRLSTERAGTRNRPLERERYPGRHGKKIVEGKSRRRRTAIKPVLPSEDPLGHRSGEKGEIRRGNYSIRGKACEDCLDSVYFQPFLLKWTRLLVVALLVK